MSYPLVPRDADLIGKAVRQEFRRVKGLLRVDELVNGLGQRLVLSNVGLKKVSVSEFVILMENKETGQTSGKL